MPQMTIVRAGSRDGGPARQINVALGQGSRSMMNCNSQSISEVGQVDECRGQTPQGREGRGRRGVVGRGGEEEGEPRGGDVWGSRRITCACSPHLTHKSYSRCGTRVLNSYSVTTHMVYFKVL